MRESIEAMNEIWTKSEAEYHGEFVISIRCHVGGAFPHGARRAIRYGDGRIPTAGRGDPEN
jgi:hypothetical protein